MSDAELSESELAAMQAEIDALKAELAKLDDELVKKDADTEKKLKNMSAQHYVEMYVLYCIQRQRIMKRASVGCGQCNI
jgi:uncharacterized small protein (DUF1192 family)